MNNIGRIVFGCIAALIIIAAIILLIPFGMSAENAKKMADDAFANLEEKSASAKYLQVDSDYNTLYFYNPVKLGDASGNVIGRIDFNKATVKADGTPEDGAYTSGSIIIGNMKVKDTTDVYKWYVIKTAVNGKEGDTKGYKTFATLEEAINYAKSTFPQSTAMVNLLGENLYNIMATFVKPASETFKVTGGSKAIAGAGSVTIQSNDETITETLQISNNLIKKCTISQKDGDKTNIQSFTFKYNGELKMTDALLRGLTEFTDTPTIDGA